MGEISELDGKQTSWNIYTSYFVVNGAVVLNLK